MPFTFSHPAIVLPLAKIPNKYISVTALIAGSMAPDFEYFIYMEMKQIHGHTLSGMFYYDLPLAIALCFVFHAFVRKALIDYSPVPLKASLKAYRDYDWVSRFKQSWLVIFYSCVIGIASHLFWDAWTHADRYFVNLFPFLQESYEIMGLQMSNYAIAQIGSSLFGAIVIFFAVSDVSSRKTWKDDYFIKLIYWFLVGVIMAMVIILRDVGALNELIATSIAGGLMGLIIAPFCMKLLNIEGKIFDQKSH